MNGLREKTSYALKWSSLAELIGKIISPVSTMILARILAPDAFGVVATVSVVIGFADMISESGFHKFLVQHEFEDEAHLEASANVAFTANLILSVLLWSILCVFSEQVSAFAGSPGFGRAIIVAGISLPINSFSCIQSSLLRRRFEYRVLCYSRVIAALVSFAVTVLFALLDFSYWSLVFGTIAGNFTTVVVITVLSKWKPRIVLRIKEFLEMFSFSMWSFLESIGTWLTFNVGIFIVGAYMNEHYLGLYKTTMVTVNGFFSVITSATTPVLFSSLSRLQNDKEEYDRVFLTFIKVVSVIIVPLGVGIFVYKDLVTQIFLGSQWMETVPFVGIYGLLSSITVVLGQYAYEYFRGLGKPKANVLMTVLHLAALVPVLIITSQEGFLPVAYARSIVKLEQVLVFWGIWWFGFRFNPLKIVRNILKPVGSAVIMGQAGYFMVQWAEGIPLQLVTVAVCIAIYFIVFIFLFNGRKEVKLMLRMFTGKGMNIEGEEAVNGDLTDD